MQRYLLRLRGICIGRCRVCSLMRRMNIQVFCRTPNISKIGKGHTVYPYLVRGRTITQAKAGRWT